ncbi:MAG: hypothetical protein L5656_07450 [Thermanaeromonas sp.]|uniref:ribonuclease toxin HepT-like protein n=1 Tax=Thermanaeromonas sp. TaxID=2003697 RepID=UPI002438E555|nr:hypothetical protein [Thermanaeromonas sp.]MCG0278352.1 hypothetical protein [Thermanaeromonas sp.]
MAPDILVLKSRVVQELENLKRLKEELRETLKPYKDKPVKNITLLRALGSILHDFYSRVEKIFLHIAREIDQTAPKSENWHRLLLEQMTLNLKGRRPPVITRQMASDLEAYLSFRHRFRNLYGFELSWDRMKSLVSNMPQTVEQFSQEIHTFLELLTAAEAEE